MAAQPIIGYNFGAKNFARVKETLKTALIAATLVSTVSWAIIHAVPELIVGLFIRNDAELTAFAVQGMHIFLIMLPVVGFQVVAGNYFQSIGKASVAIFLTLLRQVIVLIPMLLILPPILGLKGVWMAGPISDAAAAAICSVFLVMEWKRISNQTTQVSK